MAEQDCELQLDLFVEKRDNEANEAEMTLRVSRHVMCVDLKAHEFVKYEIACAMGEALSWKVQRRYSEFRELATQLENYQRDHHLEAKVV